MRSFQSRPPIPIAIIGSLTLIFILVLAYNLDRVPLIGRGTMYTAEFANAAGLRAGDPTKVAGVIVGHVDSVSLAGSHVEVRFDLKGAWVGDASTASVQLNTLLGQRYLQIEPKGTGELDPKDPIPLERTVTPYEIVPTINKLSATVGQIDVQKVKAALDAVSQTFSGTPKSVGQALDGLSRLSNTVASRDADIKKLLGRANSVSTTLADRDAQLAKLITDLNPLLGELQRRRDAIHALLVGAQSLGRELNGFVADNRATLQPALQQMADVADLLARNQKNLDEGIKVLGPYVHLFSNTVGIGHWFDAYVCGLVPIPLAGVNPEGC